MSAEKFYHRRSLKTNERTVTGDEFNRVRGTVRKCPLHIFLTNRTYLMLCAMTKITRTILARPISHEALTYRVYASLFSVILSTALRILDNFYNSFRKSL